VIRDEAKLLRFGIVGTVVLTICCFTPVLVILLGVVGLGAWTIYLDRVLLPLLGLALACTAIGLWRVQRSRGR
jgi:mercuric ion transport protein